MFDMTPQGAGGRGSGDRVSGDDDRGAAGRRSRFPGFDALAGRRLELVQSLADLRAELGLSQTEVAARMGTSQSAVARLEAGDADPRLSTIERYAAALGRRVDVRFNLEEER